MGSKRLPGKSLTPIFGTTLLELILHRLKDADLDQIWVATSRLEEDDPIARIAESCGHPVFRGESEDVLSRFTAILEKNPAEWVIRFTGDNPLIHFETTNLLVGAARESTSLDYISDFIDRRYPIGSLPEAVRANRLVKLGEMKLAKHHRSHVTSYIWQSAERVGSLKLPGRFTEHPEWRWTLDEYLDLKFFLDLESRFGHGVRDAHYKELSDFLERNPEITQINRSVSQKKLNRG
jgi:spore coat polysaccharide biosynthesis protein SpsF